MQSYVMDVNSSHFAAKVLACLRLFLASSALRRCLSSGRGSAPTASCAARRASRSLGTRTERSWSMLWRTTCAARPITTSSGKPPGSKQTPMHASCRWSTTMRSRSSTSRLLRAWRRPSTRARTRARARARARKARASARATRARARARAGGGQGQPRDPAHRSCQVSVSLAEAEVDHDQGLEVADHHGLA